MSEPTTPRVPPERVAELQRLEKAATPGPWSECHQRIGGDRYHASSEIIGSPVFANGRQVASTPVCVLRSGFVWFEGDCALIPAMRNALPGLLADLTDARAENERLQQRIRELEAPPDDGR